MIKRSIVFTAILLALSCTSTGIACNQQIYFTNPGVKIEEKILNFNWFSYINDLEERLKSNWFHSKNCQEVEVTFKIQKDGKYKDIKVLKPSLNTKDNLAAIEAVLYTAPFKPIPLNINNLEITYTFNNKSSDSPIKVVIVD